MQREHRQNIPLFVQTEYILITYVWEAMNRQLIKIIMFLMVISLKCIVVYLFVGQKFAVVLKMNLRHP